MVDLVALFEASQNRNRVFLVGLIDQHALETTLERRVFFYVLSIFIQRRCANTMQFATRKGRLEHIASVHGALGFTRAHHGVEFIDE